MRLDMGGMFSTNIGFTVLPVASVQQLYANIKVRAGCPLRHTHDVSTPTMTPPKGAHIPGVTLLFDHPYPAFPDNYGTWLEILLPLYGQLSLGEWRKHIPGNPQYIDQVVFVNLKREQIQVGRVGRESVDIASESVYATCSFVTLLLLCEEHLHHLHHLHRACSGCGRCCN